MGITVVVQDAKFTPMPEDEFFRARLEKIEQRSFSWTDKQTGEQKSASNLEWTFEITSGEFKDRKVRGRTTDEYTKDDGNKFRLWTEALLDRDLPLGMGLDTDDLIGLACELTVRQEPDKKDPSRKWERVDVVLPLSAATDDPPF